LIYIVFVNNKSENNSSYPLESDIVLKDLEGKFCADNAGIVVGIFKKSGVNFVHSFWVLFKN
jgi:hypothetical protein